MLYNVREVIESLIDNKMGRIYYYDHDPLYEFQRVINDTDSYLRHYDGSAEYAQYEPCLEFAGNGDYVGSSVDMANMKYIEENYPELIESGGVTYHTLSYGYKSMLIFFLRPSVVRSGIFDDLANTSDYIVLDEGVLSEVEQDMLQEAWELWGKSDFESEIDKRINFEFCETDWQENVFWDILRYGDGSENFPEGTSMYIDFEQVFKDKESLIELIASNALKLDSGEFEITGSMEQTGYTAYQSWQVSKDYKLDSDKIKNIAWIATDEWLNKPDTFDIETHKLQLAKYKVNFHPDYELIWEIKPINEPLKLALKRGVESMAFLGLTITKPEKQYYFGNTHCTNCHEIASVRFTCSDESGLDVCPECYNKLMEYWPKCQRCEVKNVNASLQLSLFPGYEDSPLTHCQECKNTLLSAI